MPPKEPVMYYVIKILGFLTILIKREINTFTLQSSPLQERIFSRSFKMVGSDLKKLLLDAGITASPDG